MKSFFIVVTLAIILLTPACVIAQIVYEKAYIVNSNGERIECFIKNIEWVHNPKSFSYKLTLDGEAVEGNTSNIKEFKIFGYPTYVSATVDADLSSASLNALSDFRNPAFTTADLFLQVLVDGPGTLYAYSTGNTKRYFFKTTEVPVTQLIFKEYYSAQLNVQQNKDYLMQLKTNVSCDGFTDADIKKVGYEQKSLERYFKKFNACKQGSSTEAGGDAAAVKPADEGRKGNFNLYITPGFDYSTMTIDYSTDYDQDVPLPSQSSFRIGAEAEFVLNFNKKKWALFIEPSYYHYTGEGGPFNITLSYIEFPIGLRHYFYLKKSSIFLNVIYVPGRDITFEQELTYRTGEYRMMHNPSFAAGAGYRIGRFKLETRFYGIKDYLMKYPEMTTRYYRYDLIVGYRLN